MQNIIKNLTKNRIIQRINTILFSPKSLPWTIISFGVLVRLVQYLSNRSLWNDEAALALNIVNRLYAELLQPLDYDQGAPIGFLFVEKFAVQVFGDHEYALRLFPFLCAIASLFIFYYLAKRCLQSFAVPIALALFASLHIIVYYATEVKQYSSDVAIALISVLLFLQMSQQKLTIFQILVYGSVGAVLIWFSHPLIFVLAGIVFSNCLFCANQTKISKIIIISTFWLLSFVVFYLFTLQNIANEVDLYASWASRDTFPSSFLDVTWLFNTFVEFFHKPLGFPDIFLGVAIFAFFAGGVSLSQQKAVLTLLVSPIIVTFVAAYLQKYPFDGRLVLFLTPFFILLIAEGVAFIKNKSKNQRLLKNLSLLILIFLIVPPIGTAAYLIVSPYQKQEIRPVIAYIKQQQQPGDTIYIYQRAEYQFKYYANKFGYQDSDYILGIDDLDKKDGQGISLEEWQRYTTDLNKLQGRVWIVFSHVRTWARESERITEYLDTFGKQVDSYYRPGSFVYLYDLNLR